MTEQLNRNELVGSEEQGILVCGSPWCHKE